MWFKRRKPKTFRCNSVSKHGYRCRKKLGHPDGQHWWADPGTGNGDEGMMNHTWTDADEVFC